MILPADKGNATVILDKDEYSKKMKSLFDDRTTYRPVSRDPTTRIEKKIAESVRNLHRLGHISDKLKDSLLPSYSNPPQAYGLPKVHKEGTPLRPIISSIGSPTYRLAKELARILSPLTGNTTSTVKNSSHFVQQLRCTYMDIFTTNYLRHTAKMAVVETLWQLHTLTVMNSWPHAIGNKC